MASIVEPDESFQTKETYTPSAKKRRPNGSSSDENEAIGSDSPNSSESHDSGDSVEHKLPRDISKWTEEHIQGLGIITTYEADTTPQQLLERFPLRVKFPVQDALKNVSHVLCTKLTEIENYFNTCYFHDYLDKEFKFLQRDVASRLRKRDFYVADNFLDRIGAPREMRFWFQRYELYGMQFGEVLYNMVVKRDASQKCVDGTSKSCDQLCEYDFQFLFQAFASMFGLHNRIWSEPLLLPRVLKLSEVKISGKADILYCLDVEESAVGSLEDILHIIAVCEVKKHSQTIEQQPRMTTRTSEVSISTTSTGNLPPHIPLSLLGQHGGELLLYYPRSVKDNVICGLIIQETKVTFTALKMKKEQYDAIVSGHHKSITAKLIVTKGYDFMKKEERKFLMRPLLELAAMQELQGQPR